MFAAGIVFYDFLEVQEKFPARTLIGNVEVTGLDKPRAIEKLREYELPAIFTPLITFEAENLRFSFSPEAVGIRINYDETVKRAFDRTHADGYLKELKERLRNGALHCPLVLSADEKALSDFLEILAGQINSTSKEASLLLNEETGGYHIESEEPGKNVAVAKTVETAKARLAEAAKTLPIAIDYSYPRITEKILRAAPPIHRLAAYTTYYGRHDSPNRIHNIKLMASWVDNLILLPGDEFSLVDAIGEFTPERGFKEAYVIYDGALTPMLGGGGCQVGTTLYNAVALADLLILSRQNHSFYFNIYPLGRDATIYPGQKDMKFKNNTGQPVLIKAVATNKRLSFRVYGTATGKKVEFSSPSVYLLGEKGYRRATVREVLEADAPFKTFVTRTVYGSDGKKLKEETINSFYKLYGEKDNVPISRPESR